MLMEIISFCLILFFFLFFFESYITPMKLVSVRVQQSSAHFSETPDFKIDSTAQYHQPLNILLKEKSTKSMKPVST